MLYSILYDKPKDIQLQHPDIPKELEQIVVRALQKNRKQRFQSANEVLSRLEKLRDEETVSGTRIVDLKALLKSLKNP